MQRINGRGGLGFDHLGIRINKLKNRLGRRLRHHSVVHHAAHIAKRSVHLNPEHQHHQQNREIHLPVHHAVGAIRKRPGGAQRDTDIGNPASQ